MKNLLPLLFGFCLFPILSEAQTWTPVSYADIPNDYFFVSMSVVDENIIWAAACEINSGTPVNANHLIKILRTTDGGLTWSSYDVEEALGRITWDIQALDANTAWISSNRLEASDTRPLFKTTDGGETWEQVELENMSGGVFVHFFDAQHGLVIRNARAAITNDGGDNWITVPILNWPLATGEICLFWCNGSNHNAYFGSHAWVGTSAGRVLHSTDYGWTWTPTQVGLTTENINNVAFSDTLHGVATISDNGSSFYSETKLMETFDGGMTWTQAAAAPINVVTSLVSVPGAPNTFVAGNCVEGSSDLNTIAWNQNGMEASSWMYSKDEIFYTNHIEFISPTVGYVAGYYEDGTNAILKWNGDLTPVNAHEVSPPELSLAITPNPATDYIRFDIADDTGGPYHLKLTDAAGRVVVNTTTTNQELNISHLPSGMYFLKVEEGARIAMAKVIKQ